MKITHWALGDITQGKKGSNQYQKKTNKRSAVLKIVGIAAVVGLIIYSYNAYKASPDVFMSVFKGNDVQKVETKEEELTAEQKVMLENQARVAREETILMNKKAKIDSDYKMATNDIEAKLEAIRKEKISFQ